MDRAKLYLGKSSSIELIQVPKPKPKDQGGTLTSQFWVGKFPVTVAQWRAVLGLPCVSGAMYLGTNSEPDYPVGKVTWYEAQEFCRRLTRYTQIKFRLPLEQEWEYACRGGTQTKYSYGDKPDPDKMHYERVKPTAIGQYPPNEFGLHDMQGTIWEWCQDNKDLKGYRFIKGGCWASPDYSCKPTARVEIDMCSVYETIGLRVVCPQLTI